MMIVIGVRVSSDTRDKLAAKAGELGVSQAQVLRDLIEAFVDGRATLRAPKKKSIFEDGK